MRKIVSVILSFGILISLLSGCSNDSVNSESTETGETIDTSPLNTLSPDNIYTSEIILFPELPDGKTRIEHVALADNTVYFTAYGEGDDNVNNVPGLYSMNVDGSNFQVLSNYIPGQLPLDASSGFAVITILHIDNEGFLWVSEIRGFPKSNSEDADHEFILRKLDSTGLETEAFDLGELAGRSEFLYIHALNIDSAGNIYLVSGTDIFILDRGGDLLFNLDNPDFVGDFIRFSDGRVAFPEWDIGQGGMYLKVIDTERRTWGETISLPSNIPNIQNIFSGFGEHLFIYNDSSFLNGFNAETGEHVKLLSWVGSNLSAEDITAVTVLPDGRIAATRQPLTPAGVLPAKELVLLTVSSAEEQLYRNELVFATFNFDSSRRYAVEMFNRNSNTHRVTVVDYSQFNTDDDWSAGLTRLTAEMIAGSIPDILDINQLPLHDYISHGLLLDLYPFLDADPEIGRDSIIESFLNASDTNGSLYRIVPTFYINTVFGNPSVLGSYPGWNTEEFLEVLVANPEADLPLGPHVDKMSFFTFTVRLNLDKYIDRVSGTANFDNDDIIRILELADTFPPEADWDNEEALHQLIADGRQIMHMWTFWGIGDYLVYRMMFGGDIVFKGFPTENRDSNSFVPLSSLAITTGCTDPDAAWEFLRIFITEDYQREQVTYGFPVSRAVFDESLERYMSFIEGMSIGSEDFHVFGEDLILSQEDVDILRDFVDSITRMHNDDVALWRIVREGAQDFFSGRTSAQDAARVIQNRASIYLSEQAG
jgi:ABC-type glycerol-3-phosphate transport system substrate-binding protein